LREEPLLGSCCSSLFSIKLEINLRDSSRAAASRQRRRQSHRETRRVSRGDQLLRTGTPREKIQRPAGIVLTLSVYGLRSGRIFLTGLRVRLTHRWREKDSNPRSPGYGGARCSWRRATRPIPPSRSPERRSFASTRLRRAISACLARLLHGQKPAWSSRWLPRLRASSGAFSPSRQVS
jgi:hypothetical protein